MLNTMTNIHDDTMTNSGKKNDTLTLVNLILFENEFVNRFIIFYRSFFNIIFWSSTNILFTNFI